MHAIFSVPALFALIACSSTNTNTSTDNDAGSPTDAGGGGVDSGQPADAGIVSATLSFKPSNIDLSGIDVSKVKDETSSGNCEIRTDISSCFDKAVFATVTQSDNSKITVIVVKSWKVEPTAHVTLNTLSGNTPIAIVSLGDMEIQGTIDDHGKDVHPAPGGYESIVEQNGSGPGGGVKGGNTTGGAGASYCGVGGKGGVVTSSGATPADGKASYGAPELVPLHGGSSGGGGTSGQGGAGGGGLQLVANGKLTTSAGSYINVGGGGGGFGATAGGGGSGGSLLLEANTVTIAGIIAANGGGGGGAGAGLGTGADGTADATAATGGSGTAGGGLGSAGTTVDGSDAPAPSADNVAGGGGGAAGRIRINTKSGAADLTAATISPATTSPCVSQGTVK